MSSVPRLNDFLVTARSLPEYRAFFNLPEDLSALRILDCPGGAASVTAELRALGADAVAVDPFYALPPEEAERLAREQVVQPSTTNPLMDPRRYDWSFYGDLERHAAIRREAAATFIAHRREEPDRYLPDSLPNLPFEDASFDLALTSHLLFSYADRLDEDFHVAALRELARVGKEVRAYPTVDYSGQPQDALVASVVEALEADGHTCRLEAVPYRFQPQAVTMLVVSRG